MKEVLILERSSAPVSSYKKQATNSSLMLEGVFTEFNRLNRNNRIYTADDFLPCLEEMVGRIETLGGVYGELDHPTVYETKLQTASHLITQAVYDEQENLVRGQIKLTPNRFGKEVREFIEGGFPIFVSSRAVGVMESQNRVNIKRLFTYDVVGDPGCLAAKMNIAGSFNESASFTEAADPLVKIFDFIEESSVQELHTMNQQNEFVSRTQLKEMYEYITDEIKQIKESFSSSKNLSPSEMEKMLERYENLEANNAKLQAYIKYFSEQHAIITVQKENLEKSNQHLATKVERLTENLVKTNNKVNNAIKFTESTAQHLSNTVKFVENTASHVKNSIQFTEQVAGNLGHAIGFMEETASHVKNNIQFTEQVASHVENGIKFTEQVAGNVEKGIMFTEHIAGKLMDQAKATRVLEEGLNASILYSESLASNIVENAEYENYLAKCITGINDFCEDVAVKLNGQSINEAVIEISSPVIPSIEDTFGAEQEEEEGAEGDDTTALLDTDTVVDGGEATDVLDTENTEEDLLTDDTLEGDAPAMDDAPVADDAVAELPAEEVSEPIADLSGDTTETGATTINVATDGSVTISVDPSKIDTVSEEPAFAEEPVSEEPTTEEIPSEEPVMADEFGSSEENIVETAANVKGSDESTINIDESDVVSKSFIDKIGELINEAKKRKAASNEVPHFFEFMTEGQIQDFKMLTFEEQEKVKVLAETNEYFSNDDVMSIIKEALEAEKPSVFETLVQHLPADLKDEWEALTESRKVEILNTTRFHNVSTTGLIENFWRTRPLVETASSINNDFYVKNATIKLEDLAESADLRKALEDYKKLF
jgi:hypothetical protein